MKTEKEKEKLKAENGKRKKFRGGAFVRKR